MAHCQSYGPDKVLTEGQTDGQTEEQMLPALFGRHKKPQDLAKKIQ
jgi:hypothetical protein